MPNPFDIYPGSKPLSITPFKRTYTPSVPDAAPVKPPVKMWASIDEDTSIGGYVGANPERKEGMSYYEVGWRAKPGEGRFVTTPFGKPGHTMINGSRWGGPAIMPSMGATPPQVSATPRDAEPQEDPELQLLLLAIKAGLFR